MNVGELIDLLSALPRDRKVVVRGYEEGYNDVSQIRNIKIVHRPDVPWYIGEYADSENQDGIDAIELFGKNSNE